MNNTNTDKVYSGPDRTGSRTNTLSRGPAASKQESSFAKRIWSRDPWRTQSATPRFNLQSPWG